MEISGHRNGVGKEMEENREWKKPSMALRKISQRGQHLGWNLKNGLLKWRAEETDVHKHNGWKHQLGSCIV